MYLGFNDWKISIAISTVRIVQVTRLHYDNGQDLENDTQEVENNNPPDYATEVQIQTAKIWKLLPNHILHANVTFLQEEI